VILTHRGTRKKNCIKTWADATSTTEPAKAATTTTTTTTKETKYVEEKTKGTGDGA